jgi:hypothetical protein
MVTVGILHTQSMMDGKMWRCGGAAAAAGYTNHPCLDFWLGYLEQYRTFYYFF